MHPEIKLTWQDNDNVDQELVSNIPVAIGRSLERMPADIEGQVINRIVLPGSSVSGFHALIEWNERWILSDRSKNGVLVNNQRVEGNCTLNNNDLIIIDNYQLMVAIPQPVNPDVTQTNLLDRDDATQTNILIEDDDDNATATIHFDDAEATDLSWHDTPAPTQQTFFQQFENAHLVERSLLYSSGLQIDETEYVALGGGMGSFTFVDTLRVSGIDSDKIWVIGPDPVPYKRYQTLCLNSQIRPHNRLRSGSDSCPDNVWGWPGYALREASRDFGKGKVSAALQHLWKVFAEPVFADTYTPKSQDVFNSVDREAKRIGWDKMWRYGRVRSIRKTAEGRYAIVYSCSNRDKQDHRILIAKYIHLATGYSAIRFLSSLQAYRERTGDITSVVNAYENHEHIYQHLSKHGGTVVVRGGGIVASRVIQRLYELRQVNSQVTIIHLLRTQKPTGNRVGFSQRSVANYWEFQPYNWPKATWGGDMRDQLEKASPSERSRLLSKEVWGGTTTASRQDWQDIITEGNRDKWYLLLFGDVKDVKQNSQSQGDRGRLTVEYTDKNTRTLQYQVADFIVDATGLEARPQFQPFLGDLIERYGLSTNPLGRLDVTNDFLVTGMENGAGKMYASGVVTLGGPYAPVDTFLGLQYTGRRAVDHLSRINSGVRYLKGSYSLSQWFKWALNQAP